VFTVILQVKRQGETVDGFIFKHPRLRMFNPRDEGIQLHPVGKLLLTFVGEGHSMSTAYSSQF
jgi:hypothetical protein